MLKFIRHLFLLAIQGDAQPFTFFHWYSCNKNAVILVKNITNSRWSVNQYCLLLASAVNIGLGLRPRSILLLRPIKDNISLLTIHYLYNIIFGFCDDDVYYFLSEFQFDVLFMDLTDAGQFTYSIYEFRYKQYVVINDLYTFVALYILILHFDHC